MFQNQEKVLDQAIIGSSVWRQPSIGLIPAMDDTLRNKFDRHVLSNGIYQNLREIIETCRKLLFF